MPEVWAHLSIGPYQTVADFITSFPDSSKSTLAIIDNTVNATKTKNTEYDTVGELVGMVSLAMANKRSRQAFIDELVLLPSFCSRGFATQASSLLLDHCLTPVADGGLGLSQILWQCSTANEAAKRVAIRLSMTQGPIQEYHELVENGASRCKIGNGKPVLPNTAEADIWRDEVTYTKTWKEWQVEKIAQQEEEEEAQESELGDEEESDSDYAFLDEDTDMDYSEEEDDEFRTRI